MDILDNRHKQEKQKIEKELKENNTRDKNKVLGKINELNNKHMKEKQIIEKELNKKEQELNKKEQKLENNIREINDLKTQKRLLKEVLDDFKKINESKNKENNKLKDEIIKLKELKIQRPNIIDKDLSTLPNILQDARKRDDKARTLAPPDNTGEEKKALKELTRLKYPDDLIQLNLNKNHLVK